MAGVFACPECGQELAVEGVSPGREVLCDACSTWVEVPYLPRLGDSRLSRRVPRRSPWDSPLLKGAIAFAVVALLALAASRLIDGQVRSSQKRVLDVLLTSVDQAEADRRYDVALREIESALAQARSMGREGVDRLDQLTQRRDRIVVREVEFRLDQIDGLDPDQAIGEALTLAKKADENPTALESLAGTIETKLAGLRLRRVEADRTAARQAFEAERDVEAFAAAERMHDHAAELTRPDASTLQAEARSILQATVARNGVALPPVVGRFVAGSADNYTKVLDRSRSEILRIKGYLPEPRESAWSSLWSESAPFRATIEVVETQEEFYLQSRNRTTQVDGTFEFLMGDRVIWKNRALARTRVPLPDLPALLGGHVATADKRNPETERTLHADAMKQFVEQASKIFKGIPPARPR